MVRALSLVYKIRDTYKAINKSQSQKFKDDSMKYIIRLKKELKQYCYYSDIDYKKLLEKNKI